MMTADEIESMLRDLRAMAAQAREQGRWFYGSYQAMWFSPDEIEQHWKDGRFLWGPANWQLLDPRDYERHLIEDVQEAERNLARFRSRLAASSTPRAGSER